MLRGIFNRIAEQRRFSNKKKKTVGFLGVPFGKGQLFVGTEDTPDALRNAGVMNVLKERYEATDFGDLLYKKFENVTSLYNMRNFNEFISCSVALIEKIKSILYETEKIVVVGGDHSISFGSISGHLMIRPKTAVVWIDAHSDIHLNLTTQSGNIHGMPVALLLTELRSFWNKTTIGQVAPCSLSAKKLVYIGLRAVDPGEAVILNKLNIPHFAMDSIDKYGISKVVEMSLDALDSYSDIHVSLDIDALDATAAPSTGTPVPGGLTFREGITLMEELNKTKRVRALDITEINPRIGTKENMNTTIATAMFMIHAFCGRKRRGNYKDLVET